MTSKFFRFLSRRSSKSKCNANTQPTATSHSTALNIFGADSVSNDASKMKLGLSKGLNTKHVKLDEAGEDLIKESIEHYNKKCHAIKQLKAGKVDEQKILDESPSSSKYISFKSKCSARHVTDRNGQPVPKNSIECAIFFLDQTQENFFLPRKSLGSKLYEQVFYHLDLIETDYFGLQYSDSNNVQHWLDPTKLIKKQCKIGPPFQFFFKVKFYTAEPNNLKEELTRYFYFLQLRNDLRSGRLQCPQESIASELCALILQEELGDYDPNQHTIDTVSEFRFLPSSQQSERFEELVLDKYSSSTAYKAMSPAESELTFLNKVKWLEMYGVDMHSVYGRDHNEYKLGLTPSGILVFEEAFADSNPTNNKIGLFYWPKIEKVTFSKKKFTILVSEDDSRGLKQEHTFIFNLIDEKACKHLWKCAVEYHAFFRLKTSLLTANSFGFAANSSGGLFSGFIRRGSRFRGPERTEFQTHNLSRMTTPRRSVQFERRPSQRFSRRASYAIKRKLQEHNNLKPLTASKDEKQPNLPRPPKEEKKEPILETAKENVTLSSNKSQFLRARPALAKNPSLDSATNLSCIETNVVLSKECAEPSQKSYNSIKNRNLINLNNNVSIMQIKQPIMTEI